MAAESKSVCEAWTHFYDGTHPNPCAKYTRRELNATSSFACGSASLCASTFSCRIFSTSAIRTKYALAVAEAIAL
jgi:hypothetical protein